MIGGLLIDALALAAMAAFASAGARLGGAAALQRLVCSLAAAVAAALLRDASGSALHAVHLGTDIARVVGMALVGIAAYVALRRLVAGAPIPDSIDSMSVGAAVGTLLGAAWATLFIALLMLVPSDSAVTRAAIDSHPGRYLVQQATILRWFDRGFPRMTQTLPKGDIGAVVGERDTIPIGDDEDPHPVQDDADTILQAINAKRLADGVPELAFNPDIAAVAERHDMALVRDRHLRRDATGDDSIQPRVIAALGETAASFEPRIGVEVVWAHDAATAAAGLLANTRAERLLTDARWTEVGIGGVEAGWFDGRVYSLVLVASVVTAGADADEPPTCVDGSSTSTGC